MYFLLHNSHTILHLNEFHKIDSVVSRFDVVYCIIIVYFCFLLSIKDSKITTIIFASFKNKWIDTTFLNCRSIYYNCMSSGTNNIGKITFL